MMLWFLQILLTGAQLQRLQLRSSLCSAELLWLSK